jgi:hypothetical protein
MRTNRNSETDSSGLYVEKEEPGYGMPKRLILQVATLLIGLKEQSPYQLLTGTISGSIECKCLG